MTPIKCCWGKKSGDREKKTNQDAVIVVFSAPCQEEMLVGKSYVC